MSISLKFCAARVAMFLLPFCCSTLLNAEERSNVEFFRAIKDGLIEVAVFPQNSKQLTLRIKNNTEQPLSVKLPDAMAVAPVLAQFLGGEVNDGNNAPQVVGAGGPNGGNQQQPAFNNLFGQNGNFRVPPGRATKLRLPCVCLEHGKREPRPRVPYEVRPIESFSTDPQLAQLLKEFAGGKHHQRVAPIAAWHLSDKMSWKELADLEVYRGRSKSPRFSSREIKAAKAMVAGLPKQKKSDSQSGGSLASKR
jgi:hypothetical protein